MTTRAGFAGLLTGLMATLIIYPFYIYSPEAFFTQWTSVSSSLIWIAITIVVVLMIASGFCAGRWSGSVESGRNTALGGLAGGLAGALVFCLWGAAAAGSARWVPPLDHATNETIPLIEIIGAVIRQTMGMFLALFAGGSCLGMLGGWLASLRQQKQKDVFNMAEPQMAMNASITALPASIVSASLAAAIFPRLSILTGNQMNQAVVEKSIMELPLEVSLLLVLVSHLAVTLVVPHETRQSEHLCGMDEVKMAAFVGIGAAPLLIVLLAVIDLSCFTNPLILVSLLASSILSLISFDSLFRLVLPRRASFPPHEEGQQKTEAVLFGSIARSQGPRLVELCTGCGLLMVLPLYVTVLSVLVNVANQLGSSAFAFIPEGTWRLFQTQALVSMGVMTASVAVLTAIYLFYLNLGRWFSQWNSHRRK